MTRQVCSAATRVQACFGTQISFFLLFEVILLSSDPSAWLENALPTLFLIIIRIIITIVINQHPQRPEKKGSTFNAVLQGYI